jgi:hypothetical protein
MTGNLAGVQEVSGDPSHSSHAGCGKTNTVLLYDAQFGETFA